eukprot:scaffold91636_cov36-Cyclotella_meneghiniana.AAC.4
MGFDQLETIRPAEGPIHRDTAKTMLIDAVANILKETPQSSQSETDNAEKDTSNATVSAPAGNSRIAMLRQMKAEARASESETQSTIPSGKEKATALVESYLNYNFDAIDELKKQLIRLGKDPKAENIDWATAEEDCLYYSSKFNLLEWWKSVGRTKWPEVYLVFCIWVALPNSNGFQERIFSLCTWFDNPLRQSLKETRFEMAVLLAINDAFLSDTAPSVEETKEILKKVVATFEEELGSEFVAEVQLGFDRAGLLVSEDDSDDDSGDDFDDE